MATGNWRPARLERLFAFPLTFPPFPRPDMIKLNCKNTEIKLALQLLQARSYKDGTANDHTYIYSGSTIHVTIRL